MWEAVADRLGVTFASKDAQVIIRRRCAKEGAVWRGELEGLGWQNVNQNGRCRESLGVTIGPEKRLRPTLHVEWATPASNSLALSSSFRAKKNNPELPAFLELGI